MRKSINYKILILLIITGGFFIFPDNVKADSLKQEVNFYVDSTYDFSGRSELKATMQVMGNSIYFYVENDYWNGLNITQKSILKEKLEYLTDEFDNVIYPKERTVFGSEWNPGIDNDERITVLVSKLVSNAGGYFNTHDEYPRSQFSSSNEREMLYLNTLAIFNSKSESFLAHEFQHLITFYQKTLLYGLEEDVWLNEARSEYAITLCGYNNIYNDSYLANRVDAFLDEQSDSLTEWKGKEADYGAVTLFFHYLVDHYGIDILTQMTLNNKVGIESIETALADLDYNKTFSDIFADWTVASYLNDCEIFPENKYCYLDDNLTYERLHTDYSVSYSGFPNLIVSRSSSIKDWSSHWYRFRQGSSVLTDRDTLKLEFSGSTNRGDFNIPYIITDENNRTTVQSFYLDNQQGTIYVPEFTSLNKSVILIPINQYKKSDFGSDEPLTLFSFTASSVSNVFPTINSLFPSNGSVMGGFEITVQGDNLSTIKEITFGQMNIPDFEIIDENTIRFIASSHTGGLVDIVLIDYTGERAVLNNAFVYDGDNVFMPDYSEGSLLRAKGDYKVYIIKGNYKRWIQSSEIFNQYGHLRWEDVIDVAPIELSQYTESWLIRADSDKKVYELNADGTKHWLNMTAEEFAISGRLWDMVYIINSFERDFYITGSNVMFK
ncbi:MAG: IPT/TIG domain-containing protein [bacterium]